MSDMYNTFDITVSGYPFTEFKLPNGNWRSFSFKKYCQYWRSYKVPKMLTVNLLNIETFAKCTYPIVEICCKEKSASWLKKFWYDIWRDDKLYDISIELLGMKEATLITMRSGKQFLVDESVECLKNALDASVWTADIRDNIGEV